MTITPQAIRLMAENGLDAFQIAEIAEALVPDRSTGAVRQARYRQRKKASRNGGDVTGDVTPPLNEGSNPPRSSPSSTSVDDCTPFFDKLVSTWNEIGKTCGFKPSRSLNADRKAKAKKRRAEYGEDVLFEAIKRLSTSRFHCGGNDREWRADLGWLLRNTENVTKALEFGLPGESEWTPTNGISPRRSDLRETSGSRGERRNPLLDLVRATEGPDYPETDCQPDWQGGSALRAISQSGP